MDFYLKVTFILPPGPRVWQLHTPAIPNWRPWPVSAQVDSYKYLGVHIDSKLSWDVHVNHVCTKIQRRLNFLRRLRVFGVQQRVMLLFYHAVIESIFRYTICVWFGNLTVRSKAQINRLARIALKVMGVREHPTFQAIFEESVVKKAKRIIADPSHVLHSEYELLPSGRRYRVPVKNKKRHLNRYKYSFIPISVNLLNSGR